MNARPVRATLLLDIPRPRMSMNLDLAHARRTPIRSLMPAAQQPEFGPSLDPFAD